MIFAKIMGFNLKGTSVTGKSKSGAKTSMSQSNLDIIQNIFNERLTAMNLKRAVKDVRMKRLNSLIKSAISNILIKAKKSEEELALMVQPQ